MRASPSTTFSKQEADDHLRDIRKRKGIDRSHGEHDDNVRDLNRALDLLSDQLYEKDTHFILELIQNADDNTFENDVVPTLSFHVVGSENAWQMRVDCNEVGFEKENIEALCRIGHSTKKVRDRTKGYIGEKGIGFKSVFKVANVVHISSKAYSFRLDRRAMLGMITPIIEAFPPANLIGGLEGQTQGNQTQILLELLSESEFRGITNELQKLKPQILIFLRKIRKLIIHTPDQDVQFEIQTVTEDQDFDGEETATLTRLSLRDNQKTEEKYLIVRRPQGGLVKDDRRKNVEVTEAVLAFPVNKWRPLVHAQDTYAYLPINDYGFNYLIQADFLLLANRESVDSSAWNDKVLEGVYRTFVRAAVPRFNQIRDCSPRCHSLRYTWPMFLKDRGGTSEFWSKLKRWIFHRLAIEDVLESRQKGKLAHPASLFYIPIEFRLNDEPLVEDGSSEQHHLSFLYDMEIMNTLPELKKMGVKKMEFSQFYQELKDVINRLGNSFLNSQSKEWHSKVAHLFRRYSNRRQATNIPLIPLRDGRWVEPSHRHLFFEEETADAEVPAGLDICLVDHEACQDTNRMDFFQWIGIKKCGQAEVCRMIVQSYNPFRTRSLATSVQDLIYLFQTPRTVYDEPLRKLQLLGAGKFSSGFMYAERLYIEHSDKKSIISKYARDPANPMPTLNPMYIEAVRRLGKETEFVSWVCSRLNMSRLPRLVNKQQLLSPEFDFLKAHAAEDLLLLLRDNWDHYAGHLHSHNRSTSRLKKAISEMRVHCINGLSWRLNQTVLPRETLKLAGSDLVFINIPEPNDIRWLKFSTFGVLTTLSTEFYLRELKALAAHPVTDSTSKLAVEAIYAELGSCQDPSAVQQAFAECRLVYLQELKRWVFLSECVWKGPQQLISIHKLSSEYPLCGSLFQQRLLLGNATLDHVIKELQSVTTSTSFHTLQQLLLLLNKYLTPKDPPDCLWKLRGKKIIPITKPGGEDRMDYDKNVWYFADRQSLWDRFNGKIPLISFDVKTVRKLKPLIDAMNLSEYLLSAAVKQKLNIVGLKIEDKERTSDLRQRAQYFVQLLTKETTKTKSRLLTRLLSLKVWGVQAIKLTQEVYGAEITEDTSRILFDDADDSKLEIYFSIKDSQNVMVDFELSKEFIRYCGITDHSFQKLVLPIIQYPHEEIEKLLEEYGLDEPIDHNEKSTELLKSDSEESNDESGSIPQVDTGTMSMSVPRTPSSGMNILDQESNSQVSKPSSSLRDRIPALDQSIASIREAAALPSTIPSLIITPSRIRTNAIPSFDSASRDAKDVQHFIVGNESRSAGNVVGEAKQSASSTTGRGAETPHDAFEFANFHSEFSEVFGLDTPSQSRRVSSTQHHSVPRYSRSPRAAGMEPDPESTMQGLQMQKIGLLGETFINEWLSLHLKGGWDPTCHWTSRNRNHVYPNSPFRGSEKKYADFTYPDTNGDLTKLLTKFFLRDVQTWSSNPPTYHLEVKSTSESCNEPFYMSNNQVDKAREWTISWDNYIVPENVYVVIRVYNLDNETSPSFTAYVDPWAMYLARELNFLACENYSVTPKEKGT
ncbi:hypothetical protein BDZ45DRAFT_693078 [Acephala macrosclerotiorum]|nr:hypothetical protein BDZ45DRAFT_693078 [Acephala macrosclerotiorum]